MQAAILPEQRVVRLRVAIRGAVQGVGFRPFAYRLAAELKLTGWVQNSPQGVRIEVEGEPVRVEEFLLRIESEKPPLAAIHSMEPSMLDARGDDTFVIRASDETGEATALLLPDIATCPDCLRELFDPSNRRYGYAFTNCTHCGPRFSIVESLPYDRPNTTMRLFAMCDACRAEYGDPRDRRFHAQPNACPECGPHIELWSRKGKRLASHHPALLDAAAAVRAGSIVAVKGLGGFHLVADARNEQAVKQLRLRKGRQEKPFAVMVPSLQFIGNACFVSGPERRLLRSPEAPIVLLRRRDEVSACAPSVAPGNPYLGVMLPYTPLHHLLLAELGFPVIATSGNVSDEPICIEEREAIERLDGIADLFLVHNRPIARPVDDSVVRILAGRELVLRRARGYAPLPIGLASLRAPAPSVLALGAHLKNTIALSAGSSVFLSQHIGDLETPEAFCVFRQVIEDFQQMRSVQPAVVACDAHPDYRSSVWGRGFAARANIPVTAVQHHVAHVAACMAENEIDDPALGVSWDGTGYGTDGTVWGGEFLRVEKSEWHRIAHLRVFPLPGGEAAVREPRRAALGLLYALLGPQALSLTHLPPLAAFSSTELRALRTMLERGVNSPLTSSAGRLFDAVAALTGIRQRSSFEGQAAMELEFALVACETDHHYRFAITQGVDDSSPAWVVDWRPMVLAILEDIAAGTPAAETAAKFHNTLVEIIAAVAQRSGEPRVVLTGGCFQNRYLTELTVARLRKDGFRPYWHQRVPPNDGGIALGQAAMALYSLSSEEA
jgi:hydrogenase maturation protein HypF